MTQSQGDLPAWDDAKDLDIGPVGRGAPGAERGPDRSAPWGRVRIRRRGTEGSRGRTRRRTRVALRDRIPPTRSLSQPVRIPGRTDPAAKEPEGVRIKQRSSGEHQLF